MDFSVTAFGDRSANDELSKFSPGQIVFGWHPRRNVTAAIRRLYALDAKDERREKHFRAQLRTTYWVEASEWRLSACMSWSCSGLFATSRESHCPCATQLRLNIMVDAEDGNGGWGSTVYGKNYFVQSTPIGSRAMS
jgi:hypothetical protein